MLDTFDQDPSPATNPLWTMPNVIGHTSYGGQSG